MSLSLFNARVNAIAPGAKAIEEWQQLQKTEMGRMEGRLTFIPQGRFGKAEDIAGGVIYLAADDSSYVTGQTLVINGGWINKMGWKHQ